MLAVVQMEFRYRGRNISGAEIESVRQLIADLPGMTSFIVVWHFILNKRCIDAGGNDSIPETRL
jgi:hypothetical protein